VILPQLWTDELVRTICKDTVFAALERKARLINAMREAQRTTYRPKVSDHSIRKTGEGQ
jgi:hypothetical protein